MANHVASGGAPAANGTDVGLVATSQYRAFAQKLRRPYPSPDGGVLSQGSQRSFFIESGRTRKQHHQHAFSGQPRYRTMLARPAVSSVGSMSSGINLSTPSINSSLISFGRSTNSTGNSNYESAATLFGNQTYLDIVEPLDYEEHARKLQQQASSSTSAEGTKDNRNNGPVLRQLLYFPADDLELILEKRERVFEQPITIDAGALSKRELDFTNFYKSDWHSLRRRYYNRYASWNVRAQIRRKRDQTLQLVPKPLYEVDMQNLRNDDHQQQAADGSSDPVIGRLLDRQTFEQRDAENCRRRLENRLPTLFTFYPVQEDYQEPLEKRMPPQIPLPPIQHRLRVDCIQLRFDVEIEPLFASLAIYDVVERRKVSENFYFDLNPPSLRAWLERHIPHYDAATLSRSALFSITTPNPNLALVLRVEKVLQQGDISDVAEVYAKAAAAANSAVEMDSSKAAGKVEKARQAARQYCERLGKYRMPFAWTAAFLNNTVLAPAKQQQVVNNDANSTTIVETVEQNKGGSLDRNLNPSVMLRKGKSMVTGTPPHAQSQHQSFTTDGSQTLSAIREENVESSTTNLSSSFSVTGGGSGSERSVNTDYDEFEHIFDTFSPTMLSMNNFFKQDQEKLSDDDLLRYLADLKKHGSNGSLIKKLKTIPATLQLCISPGGVGPAQLPPPNCLSPELEKLTTQPVVPTTPEAPPLPLVREILELPPPNRRETTGVTVSSLIMPPSHYILRNLLYIYPKSVNFSTTSRAGATSSARNLAVCVQLMRNETEPALPNIFGRSAGPSVVQQAYTYVLYHDKTPTWYDEIKLKLPFNVDDDGFDERVSDNYHLLFTFYHVSCQAAVARIKSGAAAPADDAEPVESPVGYTWLPLMAVIRPPTPATAAVPQAVGVNSAVANPSSSSSASTSSPTPMLISGEYNLPIVMEKPPSSYSSVPPNVEIPNMKWLDNHKGLFHLYVRPVSTIHTDDLRLEKFFHLCALAEWDHVPHALACNDGQFEAQLRDAVLGVEKADVEKLSSFLPLVLDKLLYMVVEPLSVGGATLNLASAAFQALAGVVREIATTADDDCNDQHGRNQQLLSFIYYQSTAGLICRRTHGSGSGSDVAGNLPSSMRESLRRRRTSATSFASNNNKQRSHSLHSSASVGDVVGNVSGSNTVMSIAAGGSATSGAELDSQSLTSTVSAGAALLPTSSSRNNNNLMQNSDRIRQVHEEFSFQWIMALSSSARDACFAHSWFFFEYLWQAMAHYLLPGGTISTPSSNNSDVGGLKDTAKLKSSFLSNVNYHASSNSPRSARYSSEFMENVGTLVREYSAEIIRKYEQQQQHSNQNYFSRTSLSMLNANLAFFLADCLSICDRGQVMGWIYGHCKRISSKILNTTENTGLVRLKLDLLRILCASHEHFVPLNLPSNTLYDNKKDNMPSATNNSSISMPTPSTALISTSPSPSITSAFSLSSSQSGNSSSSNSAAALNARNTELSVEYRQHHFLLGLVLAEVRSVLLTPPLNIHTMGMGGGGGGNFTATLQQRAVRTVLTLLAWHDGDVRYCHVEARQRLAQLYMPMLGIVLEVVDQLSTGGGGGGGGGGANNASHNSKLYYLSPSAVLPSTASNTGQTLNKLTDSNAVGSSNTSAVIDPNVLDMIAHGTVVKRGEQQQQLQLLLGNGESSLSSSFSGSTHTKRPRLSFETSRELLLCVLWLLKCADQQALRTWWETLSYSKLSRLFDMLEACLLCFEYRGRNQLRYSRNGAAQATHIKEVKSSLEDIIQGGGMSARSSMLRRKKSDVSQITTATSSVATDQPTFSAGNTSAASTAATMSPNTTNDAGFRWDKSRKRPVSWRSYATMGGGGSTINAPAAGFSDLDQPNHLPFEQARDDTVDRSSLFESTTSAEVSMIVLHTFELLIQVISANDHVLHGLLRPALRVLLTGLACHQSVAVLENYFATCRAVVAKFPELLFEDETRYCAELCLKLLTHCSSSLVQVRAFGASSLYLLMRQNYEATASGQNFARVKLQATIALSTLVGSMLHCSSFNDNNLKRSLSAILQYAQHDADLVKKTSTPSSSSDEKGAGNSFTRQVHELVQNFHMILSDTVKMRSYRDDADMLLDLMFRVAKGYQRSPDLRLTWLSNMAEKHVERECYAEAGMCYVHSAALVAEYLRVMLPKIAGRLPHNAPRGCVEFQCVSANVLEETALTEALSMNPDREGICSAELFSPDGILTLMSKAANCFHACGLFEAMNAVYRMMLPVLESQCAYDRIAAIHERLHKAYLTLESRGTRRLFATYFRVGFYGTPFSTMGLDGAEFVYKEPAITKLSEVAHRLEAFYQQRFCTNTKQQQFACNGIEIIKDSSRVDRRKLDPNKGYIQVTYIEPYFYHFELKKPDRSSAFQRSFNLRRFAFATPFTVDGRAHGELHEQHTKRTILTTSEAFPYIKTRIPVIKREETVQTPIELALEDLKKRTNELSAATICEPADAKMLQMVLQGCIGTSVNVGPIRTAQVFLSSSSTCAPTERQNGSNNNDLAQDVMDSASAALGINDSRANAGAGDASAVQPNGRQYDRFQHKLRLQFKEFSRWCGEAIKRNKALIGSDQREYQRELEKNYAHFLNEVAPLLDANNPAIAKAVAIDFDYNDDDDDSDVDNGVDADGNDNDSRNINGIHSDGNEDSTA